MNRPDQEYRITTSVLRHHNLIGLLRSSRLRTYVVHSHALTSHVTVKTSIQSFVKVPVKIKIGSDEIYSGPHKVLLLLCLIIAYDYKVF